MKRVVVLGSTGSIGKQTLNIIRNNPTIFSVVGLSCRKNIDLLKRQMNEFGVRFGCCSLFPDEQNRIFNNELLLLKSIDFDIVVAGAGGIDSLEAVIYALEQNKRVCVANKELLVCAGSLLMKLSNGNLIPVDSEHSAVFQCLENRMDVESITLTCSGGALRNFDINKLWSATKSDVLKHPTWKMGDKITVDCATMANKAFEVIEANRLFGFQRKDINVLLHKESLVHGLITFCDKSSLALISQPTMELPIAYALSYPDRVCFDSDFSLVGKTLTFENPDYSRYPIFEFITENYQNEEFCCMSAGVDEASVNLFLDGVIRYGELHTIIEKSLSKVSNSAITDAKTAREIYNEGIQRVLQIRKKV